MLFAAALKLADHSSRAFRFLRAPGPGRGTLRPGKETPLWNEVRAQLRPLLRKRGQQSVLARMLGLPRQRINAFVTGGGEMPDAERTLQLIIWIELRRRGLSL